MKDYVIKLANNAKAYVLDELEYKNKKYIFAVELDSNDEPIQSNVHVLEVVINGNTLTTKTIEDFEVASVVNNLFLTRVATQD